MRRLRRSSIFVLSLVSLAAGLSLGARAPQGISPTRSQDRFAQMQHHFGQVFVLHEALIRGDLAAVRGPATQLVRVAPPPGTPDTSAIFVANIQAAARRAADATTLAAAATATSTMLIQCGDCHRAAGAVVTAATPAGHDVGGIVGHMLEHQRAADDMMLGLVVPSASQWRTGAERLGAAALQPDKLPSDPKLTSELQKAEGRVHDIATHASADTDANARAARYADLLVACSTCHGLHSRIWGPTRGR